MLRGELGVVVPVEGSQDQLILMWWSVASRPTPMMIEGDMKAKGQGARSGGHPQNKHHQTEDPPAN